MKLNRKFKSCFLTFLFLKSTSLILAQNSVLIPVEDILLDPVKAQVYSKFVVWKHSHGQSFEDWKNANTMQYIKELWYYSESFYVKRDTFLTGVALNEAEFDVSRFESKRKQNEKSILTFPGSKDVIILIPANQLIYKPE